MNFYRPNYFVRFSRWLCAVLLMAVLGGRIHAQPAEGGRWLLVFDTSVTMKKRLPATTEAMKHFLTTGADGQLRAGDGVAVWTYGRQLSAGQFPLVAWEAGQSATVSSNLVNFLRRQRYTNSSSFTPLPAPLGRVIANSERLTIVILCDGLSPVNFTPYDEGINQNFSDGQSERKKTQQPFVVVLRSQQGKFVGCTVSFPPGNINLPEFPPLPPPPPVNVPAPANSPVAVAPPAAVPDLVIVGKKVGTNDDVVAEAAAPAPKVAPAPPAKPVEVVANPAPSNPPIITVPVIAAPPVVKPVTAPPVVVMVTQVVVKSVAPIVTQALPPMAAALVVTNGAAIAAPTTDDHHTRMFVFIGVGLLVVAVGLVLVIVRAGRRPHASLITSTMNDDPRRK